MTVTWQSIAYLMEFMFIGAVLYAFRETIASKVYGIRYKRWQEIDTGRYGYTVLDKALNSCTIHGMKKSINRANINHGVLYFVSDVPENLKLEDAIDKYQCYMNSEEFDTVYKNKLLQTLMLSLQNNNILLILALVLIGIAISGYSLYTIEQMQPKIDYITWRVNQSVVP